MAVELGVEVDEFGNEQVVEVLSLEDGTGYVEYYIGEITFNFSNELALDEEYYIIDYNTKWFARDGTPLSKDDFAVGDFVEIKVRYIEQYTERVEEVSLE